MPTAASTFTVCNRAHSESFVGVPTAVAGAPALQRKKQQIAHLSKLRTLSRVWAKILVRRYTLTHNFLELVQPCITQGAASV
jgi:hypothetical protein